MLAQFSGVLGIKKEQIELNLLWNFNKRCRQTGDRGSYGERGKGGRGWAGSMRTSL
jgi:hypothetical protein